jgi:NADPH2:quinone reductase
MSRTVRAVQVVDHQRPPQVGEVELDDPDDGEVLVELAYAGVNPVDTYTAAGRVAPDGPLPRVLGGEASGTVRGKPVLVAGGGLGATRDGVWAEAAVVPEMAVIPLPDGVDLQQAAAMGVAGLTAYNVVGPVGRIGPEDRVLVLGASGGVGGPICSYAASTGARVVGQTGSADKADAIRESGAADVLVTDADGLAAAAGELEPTVVIDPLGGAFTPAAIDVLARRGRLVVYGTSAGPEVTINLQQLYRNQKSILSYAGLGLSDEERRDGLQKALGVLAAGKMHIRIDRVLPLDDVEEAFRLFGDRALSGKVLFTCSG